MSTLQQKSLFNVVADMEDDLNGIKEFSRALMMITFGADEEDTEDAMAIRRVLFGIHAHVDELFKSRSVLFHALHPDNQNRAA